MILAFLTACTALSADPSGDSGHSGGSGLSGGGTADDTGGSTEDAPFYLGVNYPWHEYGIDVHTTAWGDYTITSDEGAVAAELATLADHGARSVRWWVFGDGRAAPSFDRDGTPLPLDDEALANVRALLDLADDAGLTVMPVVLDFGWCAAAQDVSGVTLGGHAGVLADPDQRRALVEDVVVPLAAAFADHPAVAAWDLVNEPEWAFDGETYGLGDHCAEADVRAYVEEATAAIAEVAPQPTTVGSASYAWMVQHWVSASPRVLQFHDYWEDLGSLASDPAGRGGRPLVVGEVPTAGVDITATLDTAYAGGFSGIMPWSGYADDDATDLDLAALSAWAAAHEVGGTL